MGTMSNKERHAQRGLDFKVSGVNLKRSNVKYDSKAGPVEPLEARALHLAGASWIVTPPVKNILRNHQINRKRNRLSGSRFGTVYGAGRRPMNQ